jgi:hypothetical protein
MVLNYPQMRRDDTLWQLNIAAETHHENTGENIEQKSITMEQITRRYKLRVFHINEQPWESVHQW